MIFYDSVAITWNWFTTMARECVKNILWSYFRKGKHHNWTKKKNNQDRWSTWIKGTWVVSLWNYFDEGRRTMISAFLKRIRDRTARILLTDVSIYPVCGASIQVLQPIKCYCCGCIKAAQRCGWCPIPGNVQGWVGQDSEQTDLAEDVPACCRNWSRWALEFLSIPNHPTILWMTEECSCLL